VPFSAKSAASADRIDILSKGMPCSYFSSPSSHPSDPSIIIFFVEIL
jgi:hypothetical protein